jgi:deoxyadenosine/deoxycytidine kinase
MRINFLAGPGAGKSTTAAWLFSELKLKHYSIELITEYVKSWASQNRSVSPFDQVYLFGKQMQYEYRFLNVGIKNVVTDSPLVLSCVYSDAYNPELKLGEKMWPILKEYEKSHPSVNIYLERGNKKYNTEGRYQTYEGAKEIDVLVRNFIDKHCKNVHYVDFSDRESILKLALKYCDT